MDGVDQLNNILIIGMTNRLDMIDEALLRPGRLEVHMEISLPDEKGRVQILNIHTSKMRQNGVMDRDVDLIELAALTKNFSGAEISGLVKSATSFAFSRHVKVGTLAGISDDVENLRVKREDFMNALDEVQPAFGVAKEELEGVVQNGIIHFSSVVEVRAAAHTQVCMITNMTNIPHCRKSCVPGSYSLTKSARRHARRSSACCYTALRAPARPRSQRPSRRRRSTPS